MRSTIVVAFFASSLFSLVGCSGAASGTTSSAAAPLLSACSGSFTCKDDSSSTTPTTLVEQSDGTCHAGKLTLSGTPEPDAGGTDKEVVDENGAVVAQWSGDSARFQICTSDGCLTCTNDSAKDAGSPSSSASSSGKCTGVTFCSSYRAGDCSSHKGCSIVTHTHYGIDGNLSFEDDCVGSTPDCSDWDTKSACEREDCTWKE